VRAPWETALDLLPPPAHNCYMPTQDFDTDTLARYLHISQGQVQKLAERGNVPGRKIAGQWRFSKGEIHHWLEERIGAGGEADLHQVQVLLDRAAPVHEAASVELSELLLPEAVGIPLDARTRSSVIKAMVELAAKTGMLWDSAEMAEAVQAREKLHPTALDNGVALLHPRRPLPHILGQPFVALGKTASGIPFGSESGQLTDVFFLICSVDDSQHLRTLARLSRLVAAPGFLDALRNAETAAEVVSTVKNFEEQLSAKQTAG
jgi:PTS system nitrogen regulatory IIA component